MMPFEVGRLSIACSEYGIAIPEPIVTAECFATVCEAALDTITTDCGAVPLPPTATERQVLDWITAKADSDRHDRRLQTARGLAKHSRQAVADAWQASATVLFAAFCTPFDDTAKELVAVLGDARDETDLGLPGSAKYAAASQAAQRIADLEVVHQVLTSGMHVQNRLDANIIRLIRVLSVPSKEHQASRVPHLTSGLAHMSVPWLTVVLASGCKLRWATPAETVTEWTATPARPPASAAA